MERSPTAEMVFRDVPGWNVKSAGTSINAVVPVTRELINWAERIIVMENHHKEKLVKLSPKSSSKIHVLGVQDIYYKCNPELIGLLITKMSAIFQLDVWIKTKFKCRTW
jgi:predicted protein tyrosine phosphatase